MTTRVTVTQAALRELVKEALFNKEFSGWSANADDETAPATVNANVDPSAAVTDPINPNFTPQSRIEFGVAIDQLIKNLPDTQMPGLYNTVKDAINAEQDKEDEEDMKKKAAQSGTNQVEEAVRRAVRKIIADVRGKRLAEAGLPPVKKIPAGVHGGEYTARMAKYQSDLKARLGKSVDRYEREQDAPEQEAPHAVEPEESSEERPPQTTPGGPGAPARAHSYKATALGGMTDVGGASLESIAKELGFSVAGAKQAVDKALEKARWLMTEIDPEDREIIVITAMNDYIKYLVKSDEVTAADVQLMKDHPSIVRDLDGFREFLHNAIRKARKEDQKLLNPLSDESPDDDDVDVSDEEPMGPAPVAAPRAAAPAAQPVLRAGKSSYKIYKGGSRYGNKPVVTRYKGKVYGPEGETKFSPNDQGEVTAAGDKLRVKKPDSDHTQTWDPIEESANAWENESFIADVMNDYIEYLASSGELTPEDIQLMKDYPEKVRDGDGFNEFLKKAQRNARIKAYAALDEEEEFDGFGDEEASSPEPCPKCGSENTEDIGPIPSMTGYGHDYGVKCLDCKRTSWSGPEMGG